MIQRVSDQCKMTLSDDRGSYRHSMNKSALGSFQGVLIKRAKEMKAQGLSEEQIAKKFNLPLEAIAAVFDEQYEDLAVHRLGSPDELLEYCADTNWATANPEMAQKFFDAGAVWGITRRGERYALATDANGDIKGLQNEDIPEKKQILHLIEIQGGETKKYRTKEDDSQNVNRITDLTSPDRFNQLGVDDGGFTPSHDGTFDPQGMAGDYRMNSSDKEIKIAATDSSDVSLFKQLFSKQDKQPDDFVPISGKKVLSARAENITNIGGPKHQTRIHNSIWDSEVVERLSQKEDSGERIRKEREIENERRNSLRESSRDDNVHIDDLKNTIQEKDANIQSLSSPEAHMYSKKLPTAGISIFDTKNFERVVSRTDGEKLAEYKKPKVRDNSSTESLLSSVSSSQIFNNMIDGMVKAVDSEKKE